MGRSMDWTLEDNMVDGLFFVESGQLNYFLTPETE